MASQPTPTIKITLPIEAGDIGHFIGPKGASLRNHVVKKSVTIYKSENDVDEQTKVSMNIKIVPEDQCVVAVVTAENVVLLEIIKKNIVKHADIFMKKKANAGKPKVVKIVFKTRMENHHQGKYVGRGGKNIKSVVASCEEAMQTISGEHQASSVRVNIDDDRFLRKGSYNKLFTIKNDAPTENQVLISVSCIYGGNPNDIFKIVKPIIIDSVVNMFPPEPEQVGAVEVDFLGGDNFLVNVQATADMFLSSIEERTDENGCYDPNGGNSSPSYSPSSPTYDPSSS